MTCKIWRTIKQMYSTQTIVQHRAALQKTCQTFSHKHMDVRRQHLESSTSYYGFLQKVDGRRLGVRYMGHVD